MIALLSVEDEYLQVRAERRNGLCVLRISGALDTAAVDSFAERADAALRAMPGPVLVDLSDLTFIDAHGARALAALTRTPAGRQASVPSCPARIRRILNLLGLPLNFLSSHDRPAPVSPANELVEQVRRARHDASEARLTSNWVLTGLTDTCIRLANTRERADLILEQGQRMVASSRAVREQLTRSRQGTTR